MIAVELTTPAIDTQQNWCLGAPTLHRGQSLSLRVSIMSLWAWERDICRTGRVKWQGHGDGKFTVIKRCWWKKRWPYTVFTTLGNAAPSKRYRLKHRLLMRSSSMWSSAIVGNLETRWTKVWKCDALYFCKFCASRFFARHKAALAPSRDRTVWISLFKVE